MDGLRYALLLGWLLLRSSAGQRLVRRERGGALGSVAVGPSGALLGADRADASLRRDRRAAAGRLPGRPELASPRPLQDLAERRRSSGPKSALKGVRVSAKKKPTATSTGAARKYCSRSLVKQSGKTLRSLRGGLKACARRCDGLRPCRSFVYTIGKRRCRLKDKRVSASDEASQRRGAERFRTHYACKKTPARRATTTRARRTRARLGRSRSRRGARPSSKNITRARALNNATASTSRRARAGAPVPVKASVVAPANASAPMTANASAREPVKARDAEPANASASEPAKASAGEPADASAAEPANTSAAEPADASRGEPADGRAQEPSSTSTAAMELPRKYCSRSLVRQGGGDVGSLGGGVKACASKCDELRHCQSFSYDMRRERCWLKDKAVTLSEDANQTSTAKDYKTYYVCKSPCRSKDW